MRPLKGYMLRNNLDRKKSFASYLVKTHFRVIRPI